MEHCDNGWIHLCGGPHEVPEGDERETVPVAAEGCLTVRCEEHCSCFEPDGEHFIECALGVSNG